MMTNVKIKDLPKDTRVSKEELRMVRGGQTGGTPPPIMLGPGWNPDGVAISNMVETPIDYEEAMFFSEEEGGTEPDYWKKVK